MKRIVIAEGQLWFADQWYIGGADVDGIFDSSNLDGKKIKLIAEVEDE